MKKVLLSLLLFGSILLTGCSNYLALFLQMAYAPSTPGSSPVYSMESIVNDAPTLSILLFEDKVYYFAGTDVEDGKIIDLVGRNSIVNLAVEMEIKQGPKFNLRIKECDSASPESLDILLRDLSGVGIIKYVLEEPTKKEEAFLADLAGQNVIE